MLQLPIKITIASQIDSALNLLWEKQKSFWEKQAQVDEVFY